MDSKRILMLIVVFVSLLSGACSYNRYSLSSSTNEKIMRSDLFCVMLPPDITQGQKIPLRQYRVLPEADVAQNIFAIASSQKPSTVFIRTADEGLAIQECASRKGAYLLSPRILQWQERSSTWSLARNLIVLEIRLIEVKSSAVIRYAIFEASDGSFSPSMDTGDLMRFNHSFVKTVGDLIN